ncbi:radical SAM protein [Desulfohalovibrio reitneri]|uniref:radical SAM protein n=1 Tax=Desulfohalovibrio reitneri TaxID=1307759 RepID=UPI0004A755AC|nr:radical SAM protein [Desulfohalovibrio reitneri]
MSASYIPLHRDDRLKARAEEAVARLADCRLCPRQCGVNRLEGELGFCRTGRLAQVASHHLHFGEEQPLVGQSGSGTIFFAQCNLDCAFCQNAEISQGGGDFEEAEPEVLAECMLVMQRQGALNVNLVTPSHVVPQVLEAVDIAAAKGLTLPIVYNSGGYDEVETLRLLDGVVDIYMPDAKFWSPDAAARFCAARDYPEKAREAIAEMHRQVGDLELDDKGVAVRGLLVRHLVMPDDLAGAREWVAWLAALSPNTYVNVMEQYRPCHRARTMEGADRSPTAVECREAREAAEAAGLRLDERSGGTADFLLRMLRR